MKKFYILIILVVLSMFAIACTSEYIATDGSISLSKKPITGNYKLITRYNKNGEKLDVTDDNLLFTNNRVFILGNEYADIKYTTKIVNIKDYLSNNFNVKNLDLEDEDMVVVASLYNEGDYICDVLILDDKTIWVKDNSYIYESIYVSEVKSDDFSKAMSIKKNWHKDNNRSIVKPTCLFLGIRDDSNSISRYSTLFIFKDSKSLEVYKALGIFLPKNNGYANVKVNRDIKGGTLIDTIEYDYSPKMQNFSAPVEQNIVLQKYRAYNTLLIDYINPQFLSVSLSSNNYGRKAFKNTLSIFPLEKSSLNYPLDLFDIFGKEPIDIIKRNIDVNQYKNIIYDQENIGMKRRNGYWVLISRVFDISDGKPNSIDISLKGYTSKLLKNENAQSINAEEVNKLFSNVLDFTTGPERNIAILKNNNSFKVVSFSDNDLTVDQEIIIDSPNSYMYMNLWYSGSDALNHRFNIMTSENWEKIF